MLIRGKRKNVNQRQFQQYNSYHLNVFNLVKDVVPYHNNLLVEDKWFYPCNHAYNKATCSNGVINKELMVHNVVSLQLDVHASISKQQLG